MNNSKRIDFIDLAKGFCIILVVAYHCGLGGIIPGDKLLRMPLYFVLSGLFFKDYGKESLIRKTNKLLIPYVSFYILGDLFYWGAYKLGALPVSPKTFPVIDLFVGGIPCDLPIWFLLCLFNCYVIFLVINRVAKSMIMKGILSVSAGMIGVILSYLEPNIPMFFVNSAFSALPFFYLGYLLKQTKILYGKKMIIKDLAWSGVIYFIAVVCIILFPDSKFSVFDNKFYGNILMAYIISCLLVLCVMFICKFFNRIPYISYIGRYSVVILLIHVPIMEMVYYVQKTFIGNEANWLRFILTMLIASAFIPMMIKCFPYITAQKDLLKYDSLLAKIKTLKLNINNLAKHQN